MTWIRADVDGDGRPELVLGADRAGTQPPHDAYSIFRSEPEAGDRYVVEGKTYQSWEQIPTSYRVAADRSGKPPSQGLRLLDF